MYVRHPKETPTQPSYYVKSVMFCLRYPLRGRRRLLGLYETFVL